MKNHNVDDQYTEEGIKLFNECKTLHDYIREAKKLNNLMSSSKSLFKEDEIDNLVALFKRAEQLCKYNKNFRNNIAICLLKVIVTKQLTGQNNVPIE